MWRVILILWLLVGPPAFSADPAPVPLAPGYGDLGYTPPAAGTYELPPLAVAADAQVLDSQGRSVRLHELFGDRYALLAFMYSSCSDINGCPLTSHVFYQLQRAMAESPELDRNLRLVSLSFDPQRDTPEVLRLYANNFKRGGDGGRWRFATTASERELEPILQAYQQDVQRTLALDGGPGTDFFHVLRVFLVDPQRRVRNIYSVSFLHADLILADLQTLLMGESAGPPILPASTGTVPDPLLGPGDRKDGYADGDYRTRSLALPNRTGAAADLLSLAQSPPLGLPGLEPPPGLVLNRESIALGRKLFFDRRLSLNDTFSCGMCHVPEQGFANNELATAVGIEGRSVRRNAPSLYNVGFATRLFHDGREDQLAQQVWAPLLARNEMGNPSIGHVVNKIRSLPDYRGLFESVFDGQGPGMQTIGDALAAYQLALNSADSPFDRWHFGGEASAVSAQVRRGFELFRGAAGCSACHLVAEDHALFSDFEMHNTGVGYLSSRGPQGPSQRVQLAPGVYVDVDRALIATVGEPVLADLGLYEITENPADRWKFRTPSLRNVALSAPYMHDGSLATLREVVEFYDRGGVPNELLDPRIRPLRLEENDILALVAFLESLTGSNVPMLVADAFAAPVGDIRRSDPHWAHPSREAVP